MTAAERIEAARKRIEEVDAIQRTWLSQRSPDRRTWTSEDWDQFEANRVVRSDAVDEYQRAMAEAIEVIEVQAPYWAVDGPYQGKWVVTAVESDGVTVRPRDRLFVTKDEAQAYYDEMKAA